MALELNGTINGFINRIVTNKEIMDILGLPVLTGDESEDLLFKKKYIYKKIIFTTIQNPESLSMKVKKETLDGVNFPKNTNYKISFTLAQSLNADGIFGKPQLDVFIYYDNTNCDDLFKLIDLISDSFTEQNIKIKTKDGEQFIRNINCEGQTSQVAIINNFERIGIRFSFYASLYKI